MNFSSICAGYQSISEHNAFVCPSVQNIGLVRNPFLRIDRFIRYALCFGNVHDVGRNQGALFLLLVDAIGAQLFTHDGLDTNAKQLFTLTSTRTMRIIDI